MEKQQGREEKSSRDVRREAAGGVRRRSSSKERGAANNRVWVQRRRSGSSNLRFRAENLQRRHKEKEQQGHQGERIGGEGEVTRRTRRPCSPLSGRAREVRRWLEMVALVDEVGGEWWMSVVGVLMVRRRTTTPA